MFKEVSHKVDFPAQEEEILRFWEEKDIFQRSIDQRQGCPDWVFYDGPPGTNGQPHVGHMMQSALKDLFGRYKTMRGFRALRKAGWDTHGLPIELTAERELKLGSKRDIEEFGVSKYIDQCRKTVFRYKSDWEESIRRIGRFLDMENAYATLTNDYIQSDWWTVKNIWNPSPKMREKLGLEPGETLLYKTYRISPYCPRCGTTLSNFETAQGYQDTVDFALFPKFRDADEPDLYYIAWTTTAWTLLSNVALAVGPDIEYVTLKLANGDKYLLAESRLHSVSALIGEYEIIDKRKGRDFAGRRYIPLWDFLRKPGSDAHTVIADNFVTVEDGTGIVHLAAYGEDDFRIIRERNLPLIQNVDENGECHAGQFSGRYFKDDTLEVDIIKDLAKNGLLFHREKHTHSYPFCFRCDSALMYFPRASWFIKTSRIKDKLLEANQAINWYPGHIKNGRFGKWLENNVDWNITRERYWGSPLPIWSCEKCGNHTAVASIAELDEQYFKAHNEHLPGDFDPHKPQIDKVELRCECGGSMKRENFVLDSWFNAGIMPWGQFGYPAAPGSVEIFDNQFPGDFICEAIDQTRGWFYTMLAAAVLVKGETSYKNCICTELIMDESGHKMSKSKGNVVHPMAVLNKFGADSFRWVFFSANPWTVRNFTDDAMVESLRKLMIPLWNAYSFFSTYANVDGWTASDEMQPGSRNIYDRWIVSKFQSLLKLTINSLDNYDVAASANEVEKFIDNLTNWHIRRSRRRFWKSENDADKDDAYRTLYYILLEFSKLLSPFMPFLAERIYLNLTEGLESGRDSVHLEDFPRLDESLIDSELEAEMDIVRTCVTLARSMREEHKIKIRQPLSKMIVVSPPLKVVVETGEIIAEELNIKEVAFFESEAGLVKRSAKPNFRTLGPKFGARMKEAKAEIESLDEHQITAFLEAGQIEILGETLTSEDLVVEESVGENMAFKRGDGLAVVLDLRLTDELIDEGYAREFVNKAQNLRKRKGLNVTDRIEVTFTADDRLASALKTYREYICKEILAVGFERANDTGGEKVKINDKTAVIDLT